MCGIFGHTQFKKENLKDSRHSLDVLEHRGPDQWNEWFDSNIYMGHRRLSIIDLSENGRQPMKDENVEVVIVVNGEIYNYLELKNELINKGKYEFKSDSDSEVVLHGYKEWGVDELLKRMEGMYAFAIYDPKERKYIIARDRVGIKPMYYSFLNNTFAWGSELKALKDFYTNKQNNQKLEIDYTAVYDFLTYKYIPTPKTLYKDIFKLEPASYLEVDITTNDFKKVRYWELKALDNENKNINPGKEDIKEISIDEVAQKVREITEQSVKEQLMSDVPLGFFLSGGLDSSTVVAFATKFSKHINTYSIGFDIEEHDETEFAKLVADKFKTNHTREVLTLRDTKDLFSNIKKWYDEPFADTSAFPTYLVSKFAKATSTVVLTGDGGDEVFGGYNWYIKFRDGIEGQYELANTSHIRNKNIFSKLFKKFNQGKKIDKKVDIELEFYAKLMGSMSREQKVKYREMWDIPDNYDDLWHFRKFYRPELPVLTRLQYLDFHTYLPDDILTKVDRASMAVALECRVPLLSTALIEYLFSLPEEIKFHNGELKGLMKYAMKELIPEEVLTRDKKGFSIPMYVWGEELMIKNVSLAENILNQLYSDELKL